ncbi:MAG: TraB/GumN family protein [Deltaproteobacteria bacterium]|nr:TraB/GumN family protein [Deltaproteobacteria bacterium]
MEEDHARAVHRQYPAFYQHLNVARNKAWIPRLTILLESCIRAFIVVGIGHISGPANLVEQTRRAGFTAQRV